MISDETKRLRVEFCRKQLANEELCAQMHQDEGYAFGIRWCRKLKSIKPRMIPDLPLGFKPPRQPTKSRRHTPKIMLSVVIARPEKKEGVGFYGGKISMIRCTKDVVAKKNKKITEEDQFTKKMLVSTAGCSKINLQRPYSQI